MTSSWLSADPVGYLHQFIYGANSPAAFVDLTGLIPTACACEGDLKADERKKKMQQAIDALCNGLKNSGARRRIEDCIKNSNPRISIRCLDEWCKIGQSPKCQTSKDLPCQKIVATVPISCTDKCSGQVVTQNWNIPACAQNYADKEKKRPDPKRELFICCWWFTDFPSLCGNAPDVTCNNLAETLIHELGHICSGLSDKGQEEEDVEKFATCLNRVIR